MLVAAIVVAVGSSGGCRSQEGNGTGILHAAKSGAGTTKTANRNTPPSPQAKALAQANNTFGINLYKNLVEKDEEKNAFFSPHSIHAALSMTHAGARGRTHEQMADLLEVTGLRQHEAYREIFELLDATQSETVTLQVANRLWPREGLTLEPDYQKIVVEQYLSGLSPLDFGNRREAADRVNEWVNEQTRERIQQIIQQQHIEPTTTLILTNAVYFLGDWLHPFDEDETKERTFTNLDGGSADVEMMQQTGSFGYFEEEGLQVLEMPYDGEHLSMVVVLPREAAGLPKVERKLSSEDIGRWTAGLGKGDVRVRFPRLKLETTYSLKSPLEELGMTDALNCERGSPVDFSGIVRNEQICISQVLHKAFVEIDEEGTEAAAATAVVVGATRSVSIVPPTPEFYVDRPFLFFIWDRETSLMLFLGRVADMEGS